MPRTCTVSNRCFTTSRNEKTTYSNLQCKTILIVKRFVNWPKLTNGNWGILLWIWRKARKTEKHSWDVDVVFVLINLFLRQQYFFQTTFPIFQLFLVQAHAICLIREGTDTAGIFPVSYLPLSGDSSLKEVLPNYPWHKIEYCLLCFSWDIRN